MSLTGICLPIYIAHDRVLIVSLCLSLRARDALRQCLPDSLKNTTAFSSILNEDAATKRCLAQLLSNLAE